MILKISEPEYVVNNRSWLCPRPCVSTEWTPRRRGQTFLGGYICHVPNHLAACKLYSGFPVSDVFGVSATDEKQPGQTVRRKRKSRKPSMAR